MPQPIQTSEAPNVSRLDHLGIVAGICDEIGLVALIDKLIPSAAQRKVSFGIAVKAMIINGLGFVQRTLYMTPTFFKDKPVAHLLGEDIKAEDLHDDCLGDTLDALYKYGVSKLFFIISYYAHLCFNLSVISKHLDGTSLSVHGKGSTVEDGGVKVVRGYNKQGQHSLAQVVLQLVSNGQSGVPLFMSVHDGNEVDKNSFPKVIANYKKELAGAGGEDEGIWVADNALYTSENINKLSKTIWLTRAGHGLKWVKRAYLASELASTWHTFDEHIGYRYQVIETNYGGVAQVALVIRSEQKYVKDVRNLEKRLLKAHLSYKKAVDKLSKQSFESEKQALQAAQKLSKKGSAYYELSELEVVSQGHYQRGRRSADAKPIRYSYQVKTEIVKKTEVIKAAEAALGKFVLVSNEVNKGKKGLKLLKRSADQLLTLYKNGQQKVERGFRFIKDPLFMLSHLFLKLPRRIIALSMVMCLCLLIYCLAEYKLRKSLSDTADTLANQVGKQVSNPTMRWIFLQFKGIHLQSIAGQESLLLLGLRAEHKKVLQHLGTTVSAYYGV